MKGYETQIIVFYDKSGPDERGLIRFIEPPDVRGIMYLTWSYKDKLVITSVAPPMFAIIKNAAESTSMGFEVEAMARPATGLELTAGFGYTNVEFDDFKDAIFDQDPASRTYGQKIGEIDYSGKKNIFAPEYTYNLAVQYRYPLSNSKTLFSRLELQGVGDFYYDYDNEIKEGNYEIVNARLGYEGEYKGRGFEFYLWAKNIFDEEYATSVFGSDMTGWFGRAGEPQTFGVTLIGRF